MSMIETFGEHIHSLRIKNNLTLTKLAAALDIDQSTLSKIENNKRAVPEEIVPKLASFLKLDQKDLKKEYYSEKIASLIYKEANAKELFQLAEEKVQYLRSKSFKKEN